MGEASLVVEIRTEGGKGMARRLRREGRIPAVVYGSQLAATSISLDPGQLESLIRTSHAGVNTLIDLSGAAEVTGRTVLVKELQREPVRGSLTHVDLYEVDANARIRVAVPIHLSGTAEGVTMGGLIDHSLRVLELDCLPRAIPDEILVEVNALNIGDSLHVSDLALPDGVELVTHGELSVVSVVAPRAEEEPAASDALVEAAEGEGAASADADAAGEGEAEGAKKES